MQCLPEFERVAIPMELEDFHPAIPVSITSVVGSSRPSRRAKALDLDTRFSHPLGKSLHRTTGPSPVLNGSPLRSMACATPMY